MAGILVTTLSRIRAYEQERQREKALYAVELLQPG
jgi:hypothetical protein